MSTRRDAEALRALLTDECDCEDGLTLDVHPDAVGRCPKCDDRGWIPKDGVSEGWQWTTEGKREPSGDLIIPLDWLEADDE